MEQFLEKQDPRCGHLDGLLTQNKMKDKDVSVQSVGHTITKYSRTAGSRVEATRSGAEVRHELGEWLGSWPSGSNEDRLPPVS